MKQENKEKITIQNFTDDNNIKNIVVKNPLDEIVFTSEEERKLFFEKTIGESVPEPNESLTKPLKDYVDNETPYCPVCTSCGDEGCCSPIGCDFSKDCKYAESNILHLKFGYIMYNKIMELIGDDEKYKEQIDKLFDETYDKVYGKGNE